MEQIEKIRNGVKSYFHANGPSYIPNFVHLSKEDKEHIIDIGTSIICTRHRIGFPGGSFVQAIVNNDLRGTYGRADNVNLNAIRFYVMLICNFSLNNI
jgi:hypothetical protein